FAKDTRIEFAAARFPDSVQHTISFGRQLFAQALLEIRRNVSGQPQHVDERALRTGFFRTFQQHGDVSGKSGYDWRYPDSDSDSCAGECFHRMKSRFGKWSIRLDSTRRFNVRERDRKEHAGTCVAQKLLKHVYVSANQRRLRDNTNWIA